MVARHGRVARRPASRGEAVTAALPPDPARPAAAPVPGRERASRGELLSLAMALPGTSSRQARWRRAEAVTFALGWLEGFPGDSWQDRWLLSGADEQGRSWVPAGLTTRWHSRLTAGMGTLIVLRAVRPGYAWMSASRLRGIYDKYRQHNQAQAFAGLTRLAGQHGLGQHEAEALTVLTRIVIVTGKDLQALNLDDLAGYAAARRQPVRGVLVHYLTERAAALDYGSLHTQAQMLAGLFWADLEHHHPGIDNLRLPPEVAHEWKQRIRVLPGGQPRRNFHAVLFAVRSLYLDLLQWSLEDPARWAQWAAPCPVSEADVRDYAKETRRQRARMAERTRALA